MSIRAIVITSSATLFMWWLAALNGFGDAMLWLACGVVLLAGVSFLAIRIRAHRRWSSFGPDLRHAASVLMTRDRWANLVEILDLSVVADIRRTRIARARGVVSGVAWDDRRSVRYIPTVVGMTSAPYGMAVRIAAAPGQSREGWGATAANCVLPCKCVK